MALFVEVVKARSFRRAAEAIGMPTSTLSRRISQLEKALGLRLLHRTTRKVELTEAGQLYFDRCKHIVEEARLAHEQLGALHAQPCGVLRVSLPTDFAILILAPLFAEFSALYPGITFDLDLTPRTVDLVSEPFDLAIRIGELSDSTLIARLLARLPGHLYASPGYLARAGEPRHPSELVQHQCIGYPKARVWTLQQGDVELEVAIDGRFMVNSVGMNKRLATLEQGIILLPEEMVAAELASGALRRLLPQWQGAPVAVYALTETRLLPAKTQRFIEFLHERLAPCWQSRRT